MLDLLHTSTKVPNKYKPIFASAPTTSCTVTYTSGNIAPTSADALANGCRGFWETATYSAYLIPYLWNHANVGVCYNYSNSTWWNWGAQTGDCSVSAYLNFTGVDNCFYRNNYTNAFEFGDNFWAARYPTPWIHKNGYDRWHIDPWGNDSHTQGGCCW